MNEPEIDPFFASQPRPIRERVLEAACGLGADLNAIQPQASKADFSALLDDLPVGRQMATNLMVMATKGHLVDRANWPLLPTDFEAVIALAYLPSATVQAAFAAGRIHPALTTQQVLDL